MTETIAGFAEGTGPLGDRTRDPSRSFAPRKPPIFDLSEGRKGKNKIARREKSLAFRLSKSLARKITKIPPISRTETFVSYRLATVALPCTMERSRAKRKNETKGKFVPRVLSPAGGKEPG